VIATWLLQADKKLFWAATDLLRNAWRMYEAVIECSGFANLVNEEYIIVKGSTKTKKFINSKCGRTS